MKKRIIAIVALVIIASLVLAACGGTPAPTQAPAAPPAGDNTPATQAPAAPADDVKPVTLELTHHDPPASATGKFLEAWAAQVKEASGGKLTINVNHGGSLGKPTETLDLVESGAVELGWGLQSFYAGRFPMTEVFQLPMLGITSAAQGSRAIWEMFETTDFLKKEYEDAGVKVLLLHTNCDSPISTKSAEIKTVADLKGLDLRCLAGPPTEFALKLGANPVGIPIGDLYSAIEKGTVAGAITDWHAIWSFKFYEQLQYYVDVHSSVSPYFLVMNLDVYNGLDESLRKALDDCSGSAALDLAGSAWDDVQTEVMGIIEERGGQIYTLPADETVKIEAIGAETRTDWVGGDATKQQTLDKALELISKYK